MSEKQFYITDTGLGLDTVSDEMYSFGDEEDFCRLFDKLNEQQATISALKEGMSSCDLNWKLINTLFGVQEKQKRKLINWQIVLQMKLKKMDY